MVNFGLSSLVPRCFQSPIQACLEISQEPKRPCTLPPHCAYINNRPNPKRPNQFVKKTTSELTCHKHQSPRGRTLLTWLTDIQVQKLKPDASHT